jgi:hypothetical protein
LTSIALYSKLSVGVWSSGTSLAAPIEPGTSKALGLLTEYKLPTYCRRIIVPQAMKINDRALQGGLIFVRGLQSIFFRPMGLQPVWRNNPGCKNETRMCKANNLLHVTRPLFGVTAADSAVVIHVAVSSRVFCAHTRKCCLLAIQPLPFFVMCNNSKKLLSN